MRRLNYILLTLTIFILDQKLKNASEGEDALHGHKDTACGAGRFFIRRRHHNHGFMLGIADHHRDKVAKVSLAATLVLILVFIRALFLPGRTLLKTGLALQLGGACSNTFDRLVRKYVVDFFSFRVSEGFRRHLLGESAADALGIILPYAIEPRLIAKTLDRFERICFNIGDIAIFLGVPMVLAGSGMADRRDRGKRVKYDQQTTIYHHGKVKHD